jgi:SAM-dependent methyltransferase
VDPVDLAAVEPIEPLDDPVEQWLRWEEEANLVGFRMSTKPVEVAVAAVSPGLVSIEASTDAPADIVQRFVRGDRVLFPRHPLNRDPSVSFYDEPVAERWWCRFTSSRTLVVTVGPGQSLFSLKLATDHPHPDFRQPEKTRLREEADWSMDWCGPVDRIDALLGPEPSLRMVREVVALVVRGSETACLVRDLRIFQDGHHYLPALSLPWVGRQIALRHGEPFAEFWGRHYAEPVGRAKARLLARYGLWYETPNPQNVLVQLDRALRPTGVLVFRDLGDTYCATDAFDARELPWTRLRAELRPETENSFWAFGEAGERSVAAAVLADWYARHDRAYFGELAEFFPEAAPRDARHAGGLARAWSDALRSPHGERAVAAAFARRLAAAGASGVDRRDAVRPAPGTLELGGDA